MSSVLETQAVYTPALLTGLVRDFDREPLLSRKRISEFLQAEPEVFYLTAIGILQKELDSRAAQYLVALLVYAGMLFRAVCDPALDRDRATELATLAQRADPATDVRLARELADADGASLLAHGMAERLLEIIDRISDGKRILPSLMRMLRNASPFLRSKVVLMIGRNGPSLSWLQKRLQESDTRVRANAVEALWGVDTPEARELLQWATKDSNNRIIGNALVGLYRLGEVSPLAEIVKMSEDDSAANRRTAAWTMGETGDARFSEVLGRMIADSNANVRKNAFVAVRRVREATARVSHVPHWPMAAAAGPRNPRSGNGVCRLPSSPRMAARIRRFCRRSFI
ncbi:MAG: HEAT repeat domain-containing protein [Ignavibacteriota bacterium]